MHTNNVLKPIDLSQSKLPSFALFSSLLFSTTYTGEASATTLLKNEDTTVSLYARLRVLLQYDKKEAKSSTANTPSPWQLRDNGSRVGVKGHYKLDKTQVYGRIELGTNIDKDNEPLIFARKAYIGVKGRFGKLQYGKQNALIKDADDFDRSHRIGSTVHYTRNELNTKRPEHTIEYQYQWQDLAITSQLNLPRELDEQPSFRVGSKRLKLASKDMDVGFGMSADYAPIKGISLQLATQTAEYDLEGEYQINLASVQWQLSKQLSAGGYIARHQMSDELQHGTSYNMALGGRYKWHSKHRLYASVEYAQGADDLEGGKELTYVIGNDFKINKDLRIFAEMRQRTFDVDKDSEFRAALGFTYRF
ncbi:MULTISPECIES: porin [Pseudoalteromonas]|uniref:porin n=1 Tax=Pseudoalteromonas TaxID=53246 RepID=UPI0002E2426C|nr:MULTISPECIES: porin [Pseudoalteromonas]MCF6146741.1 hypothetical protein [Pseudoalteromonas mariniglutinosa NCIMB 1770]